MKRPVNLRQTRHIRASRREKLARQMPGKSVSLKKLPGLTAGKSRH
jgi:hypothetical protein